MTNEEVTGKVGFEEEKIKPKEDVLLSKEDTMFQVDEKGIAIPEKYPILLYDRELDDELLHEGLMLMETTKRQKAILKTISKAKEQDSSKIKDLRHCIENEPDNDVKKKLQLDLIKEINSKNRGEIESDINIAVVEESIKESREIIRELNKKKSEQAIKSFVELIPCNSAESYNSLDKGKTVEGAESEDWVADLISKKIVNPKYSFEEAKKLKENYKRVFKEAIALASGRKTKSYRDVIMELKLVEEKPLLAKKS